MLPDSHRSLSRALAASPNGSLLLETLHDLKQDNIQGFLSFIGEIARNGQATLVAKFFMDNYTEVYTNSCFTRHRRPDIISQMTKIGVGVGIAQARAVQVFLVKNVRLSILTVT
jgi:hypothetical protein